MHALNDIVCCHHVEADQADQGPQEQAGEMIRAALASSVCWLAACALPPVAELEAQAACVADPGTLDPAPQPLRRGFNAYYLQEETTRACAPART